MSRHTAAARFGVSVSSTIKRGQRCFWKGSESPSPHRGGWASALGAHRDWLLARIKVEPDVTPQRLAEELALRRHAGVVQSRLALVAAQWADAKKLRGKSSSTRRA